jgi:choline dehydrogenase-like flavoprotein
MGFAADWTRRRILATRKLPSVVLRDRGNRYVLDVNAEQVPNPESRVLLSAECDRLGMPRLDIRWQSTAQDRDMIARGLRAVQAAFARRVSGGEGAKIDFAPEMFDRQIGALTRVGGHHIGTARMGCSPAEGVVNAHCEAFDVKGLSIAGAAVFSTSGFANPTLVIVALALRLADHLAVTPP